VRRDRVLAAVAVYGANIRRAPNTVSDRAPRLRRASDTDARFSAANFLWVHGPACRRAVRRRAAVEDKLYQNEHSIEMVIS
jgi:hypothetical protein